METFPLSSKFQQVNLEGSEKVSIKMQEATLFQYPVACHLAVIRRSEDGKGGQSPAGSPCSDVLAGPAAKPLSAGNWKLKRLHTHGSRVQGSGSELS